MQKYQDIVLDNKGNAILSATITVTHNTGGGVATIYSDNGVTAKANPFTASGVDGAYNFYAANGRYDITIAATGFDIEQLTDIRLYDSNSVKDFGALGNGTTDDRAYFALADVSDFTITSGTYSIQSNITITNDMVFDPGAILKPANGVIITINGAIQAGSWQIFDLSAGGTIAGNPYVGNKCNVLNFIPQNLHAGIRARTETTDLSVYVDAAIVLVNAAGGGQVYFPPGTYYGLFTLLDKVFLVGDIRGIVTLSGTSVALLRTPTSGGDLISDGASVSNAGIYGLGLQGAGVGAAAKGINFTDANRIYIGHSSFNNFADEAIAFGSGSIACNLEKLFAQNCLLDTSRGAKSGVVHLQGTDHYFSESEITASGGSLSDANAYVCAVLLEGSAHMINAVVGEISDVGIRVECTNSRFVNTRADKNYGNGWEITGGGNQFANCYGLTNSLETDDTYDNYNTSGANNQFSNCLSDGVGANKHKYGFQDTVNSDSAKNWYSNCRDFNSQTKSFKTVDFAGACVHFPDGPPRSLGAADATPSVDQYNIFHTADTTTYTDFDDPVSGQVIKIIAQHAATVTHGANIKTNTGANKTLVVNKVYTFTSYNGVWYESE